MEFEQDVLLASRSAAERNKFARRFEEEMNKIARNFAGERNKIARRYRRKGRSWLEVIPSRLKLQRGMCPLRNKLS